MDPNQTDPNNPNPPIPTFTPTNPQSEPSNIAPDLSSVLPNTAANPNPSTDSLAAQQPPILDPVPATGYQPTEPQPSPWSSNPTPLPTTPPTEPITAAPTPLPENTWPSTPPQPNPTLPAENFNTPVSSPAPTEPQPLNQPMPTFTPPETNTPPLPEQPLTPTPTFTPPTQPEPIQQPASNPVENVYSAMAASPENPPSSPETIEPAPTDLSHLIPTPNSPDASSVYAPTTTQPETLVVPTGNPADMPNIPTETPKKAVPIWIIGLAIGLLLIVAGASAYFILGIGQQKQTTSIPAVEQTNTIPAIITQPPTTQTTPVVVPASATGSANTGFGQFQAAPPPPSSSAADILKQRLNQ